MNDNTGDPRAEAMQDDVPAQEVASIVANAREARKTRRRLERERQQAALAARRPREVRARITRQSKLTDGRLMTSESDFAGPDVETVLSTEDGDMIRARLTANGYVMVTVWRDGQSAGAIEYPARD